MGKQIGQKNNMRTPEEKEKIVLEHLNNHASLTELANKYSTTRGLIRQWKIKYLKEGFEGLISKTGTVSVHHKNMGISLRKPKNKIEELELEIMRKDIEIARLKKGYLVKGVCQEKEYIIIFDKNTK